jgi:hypothetical protein
MSLIDYDTHEAMMAEALLDAREEWEREHRHLLAVRDAVLTLLQGEDTVRLVEHRVATRLQIGEALVLAEGCPEARDLARALRDLALSLTDEEPPAQDRVSAVFVAGAP